MNVNIANKLYQLRKKTGLSQEEVANKLNVSRQAVSKWERAEASPDTDNLIILAKLYNISLDELLLDEEVNQSSEQVKEEKNNDDSIVINDDKITLTSKTGKKVVIDDDGITVNGKDIKEIMTPEDKKYKKTVGIIDSIVSTLALVAYFVLGAIWDMWGTAWIVFVLIPVLCSIYPAIYRKSLRKFNYPCLVTTVFLFLGMFYGLWHPAWIIFITIPLFYSIAKVFSKGDDDEVEEDDD